MQILAKIPSMDDAALAVLQSNAERLQRTGTKTQQAGASAVIPAIEAEVAVRREAKRSKAKATAAAKRAAKDSQRKA